MALARLLAAVAPLLFTGSAWPVDLDLGSLDTGSSGCSNTKDVTLEKLTEKTLDSGRPYYLWVPATYKPGKLTPAILSFHGGGGTPESQAALDLLTDPYFNDDHIVIYPAAEEIDDRPYRVWEGSPRAPAKADDIGYVIDILDDVESRLCVDTARIYATGKSQGGMMANNLACNKNSSARIAAFAPVSGAFYVDVSKEDCTPDKVKFDCEPDEDRLGSIPMLIFHGGADATIPYEGGNRSGECLPDIQHFVAEWAVREGLHEEEQSVEPLEGADDHAKIYTYGSSDETEANDDAGDVLGKKSLVTHVYDGNHVHHQWPATIDNEDNTRHDWDPASFNATSVIMAFFRRYRL
ncbi:Alpha/Beta hydrolase protein [Poronia punctata]|nr:Alpha/Beta hydrolase protein [Poronia punctata]